MALGLPPQLIVIYRCAITVRVEWGRDAHHLLRSASSTDTAQSRTLRARTVKCRTIKREDWLQLAYKVPEKAAVGCRQLVKTASAAAWG